MSCNKNTSQNNHKYIVEFVGSNFDFESIKALAIKNGSSDTQLYQWKNHVVLYSYFDDIHEFENQLAKEFTELKVKIYEKPFYDFSKTEQCSDKSVSSEWKHILLTANLVEDEKMQNEYLAYHKTQFEEWPEISQGFCNADFQQLLLYKNGRQLMLVISIPADKTLDELNPKTVENNPRMDEWNQIMGKYQEGINGTEPGEKWVFLSEVK
jgi:hypothetical protein